MKKYIPVGPGPMRRWRLMAAAVAAVLGAASTAVGPARADTNPVPPAPTTTTTLPGLPQVDPSLTNGQPPATLLSNAISLSALGVDGSALQSAIGLTQQKLDAASVKLSQAQAGAAEADRVEGGAAAAASSAQAELRGMASAVRGAVVDLYAGGASVPAVNPRAGEAVLFARDYVESVVGPYGVLAARRAAEQKLQTSLAVAAQQRKKAAADLAVAAQAVADQQTQISRLQAELASLSLSTAAEVAADHVALANQAGQDLASGSSPLQFTPKAPLPDPLPTTPVALTWAFAELGRPYVWGATGPSTFDCSGLTQFVWKAAGVDIPRVAADQDGWTVPVPLNQLLPGDLVFFGSTDIHHVGIYIGDGLMINAPHTGDVVRVSSIWWSDLAGFGRVHFPGTPVPPHDTPTPAAPAPPAVVPKPGPVPSQPTPPAGWQPAPGLSSPLGPVTGTGTAPAPPTTSVPGSTTTTTVAPSAPTTSTTGPTTTTTGAPVVGNGTGAAAGSTGAG